MENIKRICVGQGAVPWIKAALEDGGSLSQRISEKIDLLKGEAIVYAPENLPDDRIGSFKYGYNWNSVDSSEEEISELVNAYINRNSTNIFLMENAYARKSDGWLKTTSWGRFLSYKEELFTCLVSESLMKKDEILTAIHRTSIPFPPLIGLFTKRRDPPKLVDRITDIDSQYVDELVENISGLAVGCYDGEGYLIWRKSGDAILKDCLIL
jgi:hypothetical protein